MPSLPAAIAPSLGIDAMRVVEVGHILYSPALQRTPLATEAQYLIAHYVFETLGYRRYEWKCNQANAASKRAAERFGFVFEGIFRQDMVDFQIDDRFDVICCVFDSINHGC